MGWTSRQTKGSLGVVELLVVVFLSIETHVREPLLPLRLFQLRAFAITNVVAVLWSAGWFAWYVISALYLQRVLGCDPFRAGLAFLPATIVTAAFSGGLSAKMVMRFGTRGPLGIGLLLAAAGLVLFARAPLGGTFAVDVLPGMLLQGLGCGMATNPLLLAALSDVSSKESGLTSGVVNTSFMMGGALGLAALASLAEMRATELHRSGAEIVSAVNGGYQCAFLVGAFLTATAAVVAALTLPVRARWRTPRTSRAHELIGEINGRESE